MTVFSLHHGDCLDILRTLPDDSIDAIVTDPPYGTTACKWDSVIPLAPMWEQLKRVIKPKGAIVLFAAQPFTSALVMSNAKWFKYAWVWRKVRPIGHLVAKVRPMQQTEDVCVFGDGGTNYYPQMTKLQKAKVERYKAGGKRGSCQHMAHDQDIDYVKISDEKYPVNVLEFSSVQDLHPTQKPVDLLRYLVRTYTNAGETVLDFTMGSGTTGVACVMEGRKFIGIELERQYYDIAEKRINEASMQIPLFSMAAD